MDVEVFDGGTILKIVPGEGAAVPLGGLIAVVGDAGEDIIYGGAGKDSLLGGLGNDKLYGDDKHSSSSLVYADTLDGGAGDDEDDGYTYNGEEG